MGGELTSCSFCSSRILRFHFCLLFMRGQEQIYTRTRLCVTLPFTWSGSGGCGRNVFSCTCHCFAGLSPIQMNARECAHVAHGRQQRGTLYLCQGHPECHLSNGGLSCQPLTCRDGWQSCHMKLFNYHQCQSRGEWALEAGGGGPDLSGARGSPVALA